jgi:endonuclease YncB( thermonuclease family)
VATIVCPAIVQRVIDGDTFEATVLLPFRVSIDVIVRIKDYYAPELRAPGGLEAKQYLLHVLDTRTVQWKISLGYTGQRSFERHVCPVWFGGLTLSEIIADKLVN